MPRFVVLLRGVNVGKGKRVRMDDFKSLLEGLGYTNVSTILNSGNAVFTSSVRSASRHAVAIAAAVQQEMGVTTPAIVKSASELSAVISASPYVPPEAHHSRYLVAFAPEAEVLQALVPLQALAQEPERFVVTPEAAYLYCPDGVLQSKVGEALLGKVGKGVTTRNWATVLKLATRAAASAA